MDGAATVLVIVLSVVLIIFLVLAIVLAILLIRISRQIKHIADSADIAVKDANSVLSGVKNFATTAAAVRMAIRAIKSFKGGKNVKK